MTMQKLDIQENVENTELRKSFVSRVADIVMELNKEAKTEAEKELVLLIAITVKDNIEFISDEEED